MRIPPYAAGPLRNACLVRCKPIPPLNRLLAYYIDCA
ncbi:hypothetical protein Goari_006102 [Gossypium aridum]|uniref:Uncharacterized protein n=1 Tax=Gossypium aridum TaxID=34290 RepID=A0A7J8XM76_GOSAI|nr:hypothetical protein [Gossypium aridum]